MADKDTDLYQQMYAVRQNINFSDMQKLFVNKMTENFSEMRCAETVTLENQKIRSLSETIKTFLAGIVGNFTAEQEAKIKRPRNFAEQKQKEMEELIERHNNNKKLPLTEAQVEEILKKRAIEIESKEAEKKKKSKSTFGRVEKNNGDGFMYILLLAIIFSAAVYISVMSHSYAMFIAGNMQEMNMMQQMAAQVRVDEISVFTCMVNGLITEELPVVIGFSSIFFKAFGICMLVGGVVVLLAYLNAQDRKRMRIGHEHGRTQLQTKRTIKKYNEKFTSDLKAEYDYNFILSKDVRLTLDNKKANRCANVVVMGGTGTGKTFKYIKPNLLQENCSFIVTDPSRDIFRSFSPYLVEKGYNVYLFNVSDMEMSNHYNPLLNVYDAKGQISQIQVDILVDLYMKNAKAGKEGSGGDPFWDKAEKAFLTALIYYVLENEEIPIEDKCFYTILEKAQRAKADAEGGKRAEETLLTKEINQWKKNCELNGRMIKTPIYYDTFLIAPEKTANTILITTAVDLQIFATDDVNRITRYNSKYPYLNINFDLIAQTQTYVFLAIPQSHQAYNFLISMFYSQLYGRLYEMGEKICIDKYFIDDEPNIPKFNMFDSYEDADDFRRSVTENNIEETPYINNRFIYQILYKGKCYKTSFNRESLVRDINNLGHMTIRYNRDSSGGDPALPIHINFLLDEFYNIGEIPNFKTILSTSRKYRIGSHVVIQNKAQLEELYPDNEWQSIYANCDSLLFLGSPSDDDKKYVQQVLGKTTIIQKSTSNSKQGVSTSYTPTEVDLMSIDEIGAINEDGRDDCIVKIRDVDPFCGGKMWLTEHKRYDEFKRISKKAKDVSEYFLNNQENK